MEDDNLIASFGSSEEVAFFGSSEEIALFGPSNPTPSTPNRLSAVTMAAENNIREDLL